MLQITTDHIYLEQYPTNKFSAIDAMAQHLTESGKVEKSYVDGMQAREAQHSTYLGNGIAIPHGTTDTRHFVKETGVVLHHFPQGVAWDGENKVYLAIGIAAKSDEHLSILKQLTRVLSEDGIEEALQTARDKQTILAIINGKINSPALQSNDGIKGALALDPSLIQTAFPATDILQLQAVAAGLLHQGSWVERSFIRDSLSLSPVFLGDGVWLAACNYGVNQDALAAVFSEKVFEYQSYPVKLLLTLASQSEAHKSILMTLTHLIKTGNLGKLTDVKTSDQLIAVLKEMQSNITKPPTSPAELTPTEELSQTVQAVFVIHNPHGLHTRPSAILVSETKKYAATLTVANMTTGTEPVNAKNLMKVMTLGAKTGHQLAFTATGKDAQLAIESIGALIASGLGES